MLFHYFWKLYFGSGLTDPLQFKINEKIKNLKKEQKNL